METIALIRKNPQAIVIAVSLILGLTACEGPQGPRGPSPISVNGQIYLGSGDTAASAYIYVSETPTIPVVTVNDVICSRSPFMYDNEFRFYNYDLPIVPGDSIYLTVTFTGYNNAPGLAGADVLFPTSFGITSHDTTAEVIIPVGTDLMIEWTESIGSNVYSMNFYINYCYYDTLGVFGVYRIRFDDSLLFDTAVTFDSETLFPNAAEIDSISFNSGSFHVWALTDPFQGNNAYNVYGDGVGFISVKTYGDGLYFAVEP